MNDSSAGTGRGLSGSCASNSNPANSIHPQLHPSGVTTVQPQSQSKSGNFAYATARSIGESATISLLASTSAASNTSATAIGHECPSSRSGPQSALNSGHRADAAAAQTTANNSAATLPRKVFIQRDYSEGTAVRFQTKFPSELEGYIEWQHFDYLVSTLNCYYDKAEAANSSTFCEGK